MPATKPPTCAKNAVPPCDASVMLPHSAENLHHEPVDQHEPGRQVEAEKEEAKNSITTRERGNFTR